MPIRILHVVDSLGTGGLENGLVNLIERLDPAHFEHVVVAMRRLGPNAERLRSDGVRVECLAGQTWSRIHVAVMARAIRRFEPDIVHSRNWAGVEAVAAGRWARSCALVHSEHGLDSNASLAEPWRKTLLRRLAFEMADCVLAVSYELRDVHAQRTGFPARKIDVIHNGVDARRFCPDGLARRRMREDLGLPEDAFCIGCVGSLFPVKGHITLLRAIESMAQQSRDSKWRVLLIGEGPELGNLRAFVDAHPAWSGRICFLGTSNRVRELLNAMDVYALPSVSEGISNSLLEAMASGLPVVATATGGNPEVVVDGKSGLLFRVGDSDRLAEHLLLLEGRPELRLKLGQEAMDRVLEEFAIDEMVSKYDQVYKRLVPAWKARLRVVATV